MASHYPSPDTRVVNTSGKLQHQLCKYLNSNKSHLQEIAANLDPRMTADHNVSTASDLIALLVKENKTVSFLINHLQRINSEGALALLIPPEPLAVLQQPESVGNVYEGEMMRLECRATGFPLPRYQWYKGREKLDNQTGQSLCIQNLRMEDSGKYWCAVYHILPSTGEREVVWSAKAGVTVVKKPISLAAPISVRLESYVPKITVCEEGGIVYPMKASAEGPKDVMFQWFRNGTPVVSPEAEREHLYLNLTGDEGEVTIVCEAWEAGNERNKALTHPAKLTIEKKLHYQAKEKVALLIGNMFYRSAAPLHAVKKDVACLDQKLTELHYKVFTFIDLTLQQMEQVVKLFCQLLSAGVYAVFYFAGHGFERQGQCYLVAQDTHTGYPISDCLCAEQVQTLIQKKDPALCFFILDICREGQDPEENISLETYYPNPTGNTCMLYATCRGLAAYEDKWTGRGYLAIYLCEVMDCDLSLDAMATNLKIRLSGDTVLNKRQLAEVKSDLSKTRSLKDPLRGDKAIRDRWEAAHYIDPRFSESSPFLLTVPQVDIQIRVHCTMLYSNILCMHVKVVHLGYAKDVSVEVDRNSVPLGITLQQARSSEQTGCPAGAYMTATFSDLQALQRGEELMPLLLVKFSITTKSSPNGKNYVWDTRHTPLCIGKPLCSALDIWKD